MNRPDPWCTSGATALTAAIVSIGCAVAVLLFPEATVEFVNSWTHGLDLAVLRTGRPMTLGSVLLGLFNVSLAGFAVGALFAWARTVAGRGSMSQVD